MATLTHEYSFDTSEVEGWHGHGPDFEMQTDAAAEYIMGNWDKTPAERHDRLAEAGIDQAAIDRGEELVRGLYERIEATK